MLIERSHESQYEVRFNRNPLLVNVGDIYQHYLGAYYEIVKVESDYDLKEYKITYVKTATFAKVKEWTRTFTEFFEDVSSWDNNFTGQATRFKLVNLKNPLKMYSTVELLNEIRNDRGIDEKDFKKAIKKLGFEMWELL